MSPARHNGLRWLQAGLVLCLLAADSAVLARREATPPVPLSVAVEQGSRHESVSAAAKRADERDRAVKALFERRAAAIRARDHAALRATIDPVAKEFQARQDTVLDSLGKLDLAVWSYEPQAGQSYSPTSIHWQRYVGADDLWLPVLHLRYQLAGFDRKPVARRVVYTVVRRGKRWYVADDSDLEDVTSSGTSVRVDPWENGPIIVSRSAHGLVIGHPKDAAAVAGIEREVESAIAHVSSYVGTKWGQKVVVVLPADHDELNRVLENPQVPFDFAAIARPLSTSPDGDERDLAGSRVVINPDGFHAGDAFTRTLIRHELTHVATFDRTGPESPKWLIEGLAEYVGNAGSTLATYQLGSDLGDLVDKEGVPNHLPLDSEFGLIAEAGIGYNSAWLLCRYLASHYGRARLLAFYDDMGSLRDVDAPAAKLDAALRRVFGIDEDALLRAWRPYVRAAVGDLTKLLVAPDRTYHRVDRGQLDPTGIARERSLSPKAVAQAGIERAGETVWYAGSDDHPDRVVLETAVVARDEASAAAAERLLAGRYTSFDSGYTTPHGRAYRIGIVRDDVHYHAVSVIERTGIVVIEVRIASLADVPLAETGALALRAYDAAVTV